MSAMPDVPDDYVMRSLERAVAVARRRRRIRLGVACAVLAALAAVFAGL
jgi:hypothetical protein